MLNADEQSKAPPPRMSTAAKADSMTIEDVIQLAAAGRLRMPSFQRPFRWEPADRRALLDSIYRGYPVGTLLLWKNPPSDVEFGRPLDPAGTRARPAGDEYLVIDGQQRLTTLWEALGRKPKAKEAAIVFDIQREEVRTRHLTPDELEPRAPSQSGNDLPEVPLYLVLDAASLSEWVPKWLSLENRRRYFELGKRIREYKLGLYIVEGANIEALRHVFDRVNTTGKAMRREEVFDALVGSRIAKDGAAGLALVNARLVDLGFGELDSSTILKAFEAIRGDQVGRLDPRQLDVTDAEHDLLRTADAIRAAIEFLRDLAHIPHVAVRPYELPVVVLARFFAIHERPSHRSLILLRRWLWRASLGERLGGASGSMQQHVNDVAEDENQSVQALLQRTGSPADIVLDDWSRTASASVASARGKMLVCALLARQPRNLVTGERIDVSALFRDGNADLLRPIIRGSHGGKGIVNKLLHPTDPMGARQLILECTDEAALVSHGIDDAARDALRRGDAEKFYSLRGDVLRRSTLAFFEKHAELGRDDSPPLVAMTRRTA
jgi:hypothetical protein